MRNEIETALITGGNGNLGKLVGAKLLADGVKVIKFDIPGTEPADTEKNETIVIGDIRDTQSLDDLLGQYKPDTVYHLASLLSGSSEADHLAAWEINATGSFHLLQQSIKHQVRTFFFASTNASYGGGVADPMPEDAEQWPENVYGATKVAVERLGVFFKLKRGLDFRCLRFPMVISPFAPSTAVTAYPSHAFKSAVEGRSVVFPVSKDTGMSTIFLDDVVQSIVDFTYAPQEQVKRHAYNLHAYYISAQMVADEITRRYPEFDYRFEPDAVVQSLIANWPDVIDDSCARADWGWTPQYDFAQSASKMFDWVG